MRVRAIKMGYYSHKRRPVGSEFHIMDKKHFSKKWMFAVDKKEMNADNAVDPTTVGKVSMDMSIEMIHDYCKENGLASYQELDKKDLVEAINMDTLDSVSNENSEDVI